MSGPTWRATGLDAELHARGRFRGARAASCRTTAVSARTVRFGGAEDQLRCLLITGGQFFGARSEFHVASGFSVGPVVAGERFHRVVMQLNQEGAEMHG